MLKTMNIFLGMQDRMLHCSSTPAVMSQFAKYSPSHELMTHGMQDVNERYPIYHALAKFVFGPHTSSDYVLN